MDCIGIIKIFNIQDKMMFREIKQTQFEYYYAEEGIYIFRKIGSNILHIVKGSNPFKALDSLISELIGNGRLGCQT
ncbi:TPA: hypothetical protein VJ294_000843 [Streptococcus pyogenes]|uniref:hypothetical protein n=1 Tax=Streptococcus pyogenes TaxID=1314 RepID=UPI000DA2F7D2|nr:hypothetical protein [Streptococcus pyogenes]SQF61549.1 Uncharacterised protein [Streptococcus pyogenes]HEP1509819.1 hypothetical protein [Streptococcus pyogenes]HER1315818.1 hypothetical protein [Streptococcus pyogenes]HER2939123.1 hypothetical protein [Streptococcus pyogenes]HER5493945.1 hypothetical protein [Streptococcus pyogenes]